MSWPFPEKQENAEVKNEPEVKEPKAPEKSPAELLAEALKPFGERFDKLDNRMDSLEANTRKPAPKLETPEQISVLDDENVAFAQRLTPLMFRQLELEARIVKSDVKSEYVAAGYGDLWAQFEKEINAVIDETPLVSTDGKPLRGNPDYIRNCVDMVFGRNARKGGMRFDGKSKGFFLESATNGSEQRVTPEADGLTDAQRRVFSRMRVSLDDAKKVMGKLKFVS